MTQTSTAEITLYAQVTLGMLPELSPAGFLALIEQSKYELEGLEAGMHGQTGEARALQNRVWSAQHAAQLEIVKTALATGVPAEDIMAITHRNAWDAS